MDCMHQKVWLSSLYLCFCNLLNLMQAVAETTLGFIKEAPALGITGFNVYHKNRLIRVSISMTVTSILLLLVF